MCGYPVTIKNPHEHRKGEFKHILVPCGKCVVCCKKRAANWHIRLHYENKIATSAYFVTLTYENPQRTFNGLFTCDKRDLQLYFKRLRKREKNTAIKYYAVSEYGEKFHRPHYHIIIFNVIDKNNLIRAWEREIELEIEDNVFRKIKEPIGLVHIGDVSTASMLYVTGYIGKRIGIPQTDYDDRLPEFSLMSKNLGASYYLDHIASYHDKNMVGFTVLNGKKFNLPRYYKNKIWPDTVLAERITEGCYFSDDNYYIERKKTIYRKLKSNAKREIISHQNYLRYITAQDNAIKNIGSVEAFEKNERHLTILNNASRPTICKSAFYD